MAQAFVTTYQNHYRWNLRDRVKACRPVEPYSIVLPMDESWITHHVPVDQQEVDQQNQLIEDLLLKKRLGELRSVYQIDYTHPNKPHHQEYGFSKDDLPQEAAPGFDCAVVGVEKDTIDETINYGRDLYEHKLPLPKVLAPLVSHRKIFGYIRAPHCYTPLTTYQKQIGKVGYDILKQDYLNRKDKFCGTALAAPEIAAIDAKIVAAVEQPKTQKKRKNKCKECCTCCPCYRGEL